MDSSGTDAGNALLSWWLEMDPTLWRAKVIEAIRQIASREYQRVAWFGAGAVISSPVEAYCGLFDDCLFERFLESPSARLSEDQREAGWVLVHALNQFAETVGDAGLLNAQEVFNHPDWPEVQKVAYECLDMLDPEGRR